MNHYTLGYGGKEVHPPIYICIALIFEPLQVVSTNNRCKQWRRAHRARGGPGPPKFHEPPPDNLFLPID